MRLEEAMVIPRGSPSRVASSMSYRGCATDPSGGGDKPSGSTVEHRGNDPATGENGGAKLDHRAANRSCFWAE